MELCPYCQLNTAGEHALNCPNRTPALTSGSLPVGNILVWPPPETAALRQELETLRQRLALLEAALELVADDYLFLGRADQLFIREHYAQGAVTPYINCNDTFYYACADAEPIDWKDLPELARRVKAEGWPAAVRWAAEKRQAEPLPPIHEAMDRWDALRAEHDRWLAVVREWHAATQAYHAVLLADPLATNAALVAVRRLFAAEQALHQLAGGSP